MDYGRRFDWESWTQLSRECHATRRHAVVVLKVPLQFDFFSFLISFAKNQTFLVSTAIC